MPRHGFSFLVCVDSELVKDRVRELLHGESFVPRFFWGDEELPLTYWQTLTMPAMMGPPVAVVLRRAQEQSDEFWTRMEALLASARSAWPMFCLEGEWQKGKPAVPRVVSKAKFWPVAQKKGWIWEHQGLTRAGVGQELDRFAAQHGLHFGPGVKKMLAESLPLSCIALRNELEKILLLAGENTTLQPAHLAALDTAETFDLFAFLRSLQQPGSRQKLWDQVLNDPGMSSGDMVFPIISLLTREARLLWQLLHGQDVQLFPGLKAEKTRLAQRLGAHGIARFWDLALAADTGIKTGQLRPEQALEALVRDVARL